ncbi:hypothetical protein FI667_g5264, partial [Globisporangium splendens]
MINDFVARDVKISLHDFTQQMSQRFYPEQALSFMEYFSELADQANDGKFVVHHEKLAQYGATTQCQSSARKYAKYYVFLEKIIKYYGQYQKALDEAATAKLVASNSEKQSTIDKVFEKLNSIEAKFERAERAEIKQHSVLRKLDTVVELLQQKSIVSTMNPVDPKLHHNFVCVGYRFTDDKGRESRKLAFIAGQGVNVRHAMRKKFADKDHDWTVQIGVHYNANPIDLRNNIYTRVTAFVKGIIARENRRRSEKLQRGEIPIKCIKTTASYTQNDYIIMDFTQNVTLSKCVFLHPGTHNNA